MAGAWSSLRAGKGKETRSEKAGEGSSSSPGLAVFTAAL